MNSNISHFLKFILYLYTPTVGQHIFEETSELKLRDMTELRFLG